MLAAAARCFFSTCLDATGILPDAAFAALAPELRDALTRWGIHLRGIVAPVDNIVAIRP